MLNHKYPLNLIFNVHKYVPKSGQKRMIHFPVKKICRAVEK